MNQQQFETRNQVDERILKSYKYGSRVYGCHTELSDHDYIFVVESDNDELYYSVEMANLNITVYSESKFISLIESHHISILECIFQNENDKYLKYFELDLEKLRRNVSGIASNSYVKCKKKIAQDEEYIGKKSMFHSLRILNFGIQIAKYGKITNYSCANVYHKEIFKVGASSEWKDIDAKFKPIYNSLKTLFKKVAPLESDIIGTK